jgi:tryptophan-rich sensory protein
MNWLGLALAVGWGLMTAIVGMVLTVIGDWYHALRKPGWKPPDWAFGPVWTTIFILSGIAFYQVWVHVPEYRFWLVVVYVINGGFNVFWNVLFFTWRRPDWALIETGFLWASIAAMMVVTGLAVPWTALLVLPYLVWVSIAWALNWKIVQLNDFGSAATRG